MLKKLSIPLIALSIVSALLLSACGSDEPTATPTSMPTATPPPAAGPTATPTSGPPAWEAEWEALIEAAKAEGDLIVNAGRSGPRDLKGVFDAFTAEFGIEASVGRGSGREGANRMLAEREAGVYQMDIIITGLGTLRDRLLPSGAMAPVKELLFHPDVIDQSLWRDGKHRYVDPEQRYFFVFSASAGSSGIHYNTDLVDPAEITSRWDLLDPKWDGKIISTHPTQFAGLEAGRAWMYYNPDLGPDFLRQIYASGHLTLVTTDRELVDGLAAGAFHLAFEAGPAGREITAIAALGLPVASLDKEMTEGGRIGVGGTGTLAVVNRAANPNAQKLFSNWLLTQATMDLLNRTLADRQSLRADVSNEPINPEDRLPDGPVEIWDADPDVGAKQTFVNEWIKELVIELGI